MLVSMRRGEWMTGCEGDMECGHHRMQVYTVLCDLHK